MGKIIGYVRVSTQRQGKSGLGLEAQLSAINAYAAQNGAEVVAMYEEIESGRVSDRPQLAKALAHARKAKAAFTVAKLDRLSRTVSFIAQVLDSGAEFIAVDNPLATRLTLHILAAVAEHEAAMISARTKAALQAARARGVRLGSPVGADTSAAARAARSAKARNKAQNLVAIIRDIERSGINSLAGVAKALEARGVKTPSGNMNWQPTQVARIKSQAV
jgi:DNA invertase Pin-like site-specific DNA recombinase